MKMGRTGLIPYPYTVWVPNSNSLNKINLDRFWPKFEGARPQTRKHSKKNNGKSELLVKSIVFSDWLGSKLVWSSAPWLVQIDIISIHNSIEPIDNRSAKPAYEVVIELHQIH